MNRMLQPSFLRKGCAALLVLALYMGPAIFVFSEAKPAQAANLTQLERDKAAAEAAKKKAEAEAAKKKATAEKAASQIAKVTEQISSVQSQLQDTQDDIQNTEIDIENQNQTIAGLESELRRIQEQQDALVRYMYVLRASQGNDELALFSNEGISRRERDKAQFSALVQSVMALYTRTTEAKMAVQQRKTELENKNQQLALLKDQQSEQQRGLSVYRSTQAALKNNAEQAVAALEAEAIKVGKRIASLEDQIRKELASRVANAQGVFGSGPGVGTRVSRGQRIGTQGSTGFSTGEHVHLEVNLFGPANGHTNPRPYLNNGTISWPLRSFVVTQEYGNVSNWYSIGYHMGIDIAGPIGSPVYAPADGIVVLNEYFGGYGNAWAMKVDNGPYVLLGHLRR